MNSQLIIACGAFAGILALVINFYTKHENINKTIKIAFIVLLLIDLVVFAYALSSTTGVNSPPMVIGLMSDKANPQEAGTTIKWTAATLDPENDKVQYKFFLDGQPRTDWSYDSTWYWTTSSVEIGSHTIEIKAKDGNHEADGDDSKSIDFTISPQQNRSPTPTTDDILPVATPNLPPSINALDATPNSPQTAGTSIDWTTDAVDPDNDKIYYQYLLNGNPVTGWDRSNEWAWQTGEENIGSNIIEVLIRDKNHAGPSGSDDRKGASFTISSLEPSPSEPLYEMQTSSDHSPEQQSSQTISDGPDHLSSLGAYHHTFDNVKYDSAAHMKIGNIEYNNGIQLCETSGILDFIGSQVNYNFAYFNLNKVYSHLTGQIGLDDLTENSAGNITVCFGDGETLEGPPHIYLHPGDLPVNVDLDVRGIRQFAIAVSKNQRNVYVDLIDMKLEK